MAIRFHQKTKEFHIFNGEVSYLMRIMENGQLENLYYGKAVRSDITRITRRLGDEIGKVYGWDFPKPRQAVSVER